LLERQGNLEQAAQQYREALQLTPDLVSAHNRLGITLNKLGQHAAASAEFRAALARSPSAAYLHNNLGFSLYLEGKYAEAEQAVLRAVELQPTFRRAQMNRGLVLAKLGRYQEALAAFQLAGSEPDAYYNLALVQTDAGLYADAARSLEQALRLKPDFPEARQQLREVARLTAEEEAQRTAAVATATDLAGAAVPAASEEDEGRRPVQGPVATAAGTGPGPIRPADDLQTAADLSVPPLAPGNVASGPGAGRRVLTGPGRSGEPTAGAGPGRYSAVEQGPGGQDDLSDAACTFRAIEELLATAAARPLTARETTDAGFLINLFEELGADLLVIDPRYAEGVCRLRELTRPRAESR
jgi:Flp pilus assembly protein TadD